MPGTEQVLHDMRGELVLGAPRLEELHELPVRGVADRADHAQRLLLVLVLDRARLSIIGVMPSVQSIFFGEDLSMLMSMKSTPSFMPATFAFFISCMMALVNFFTCAVDAGPAAPFIQA
jgi:hypothetical protein